MATTSRRQPPARDAGGGPAPCRCARAERVTGLLIRGKPLDAIRASLEEYCAVAGRSGPLRRFVLTRYGYGYSLASLAGRNRARLAEVIALGLIGQAVLVRLPLSAHRLRVKNSIRVFFERVSSGEPPVTAKIALASEHRSGSLAHEIAARRELARATGKRFAIPRILSHDGSETAWFEEDFIATDGAGEADKIGIFLNEVAATMYRHGLARASLTEALALTGTRSEDLEALRDLPPATRSFGEAAVTVSRIHGDLAPANMILGRDGRLYMIDWELSGLAPVAWDLKKFFAYDRAGTLRLLDELTRPGDAGARDQMRLALCCQLAGLRRDRDKRFAYLTSNRNKSRRAAQAMIAKQEKELLAWITELARP